MSRAFVDEDTFVDDVPDRPVSPHTNYVTPAGLAQIDAALDAAQRAHAEAQAAGDRDALARASRDLRYWNVRRSTAQLLTADPKAEVVHFGSTVTFMRDGRRQTFQIVGEDEANPSRGTISYVSPLARALLGKTEGELAAFGNVELEILTIA